MWSFSIPNHYLTLCIFLTPGGFHWNLNDIKYSQISRTLFNILADFSCAVIWIVSILSFIPSVLTKIGITVQLSKKIHVIFLSFYSFLLCGQLEKQDPLDVKFFFS